MGKAKTPFMDTYDSLVLGKPYLVLIILFLSFCFFGYKTKDFKLDASADSLILENDEDLRFFRETTKRYSTNEYLFITSKPKGDIFSKENLNNLKDIRNELRDLDSVETVFTILDVPLLKNPPVELKDIVGNIKFLEDENIDIELAKKEFKNHPVYLDQLIDKKMEMVALQVNFYIDLKNVELINRKNELKQRKNDNLATEKELLELERVIREYNDHKQLMNKRRHYDISDIRKIMANYKDKSELHLGGVAMVTDDMISFISNDLKVFGFGVLAFLVITLALIFRNVRWIFLAIVCCGASAVTMIGILGVFGWEVTVISSNFISIQLIVTMSLAIHLIVRYRELTFKFPHISQRKHVRLTVHSKWIPCLYTALTTIAGFSSLMVCDILPVINFGWMMSAGLAVSLTLTFLLFPSILILLPKDIPNHKEHFGEPITSFFARTTEKHGKIIIGSTFILIVLILIGISKLEVENSFINYFHKSTEIYQGMELIDQTMGGTTPLDIIIKFDDEKEVEVADTEPSEDSDFDDFEEFEEAENDEKYWLTSDKVTKIKKIHDYLDSIPEIGKVLSMDSILQLARQFNKGKNLDNFELALLYKELPENFRDMILTPFISAESNQARLTMRIKDSNQDLKRDKLLKKITNHLHTQLGFKKDNIRLTGMMVLYNNMLQSLFSSQISTMGFVLVSIIIMFLILFRSVKISLIAIFPNLISSVVVLGVMGLSKIPLDMMTITIAAISIGIAVDNTIHYIHRFEREFKHDHKYLPTMYRCHGSIGNAMYYTSITIIIGFSILIVSNFIPSVLFGLLTGVAMAVALVGALTLLPKLILIFKPFGPESEE